jgi:hypothetical protein
MNQGSRTDRAMKSAQPFGFKKIGGKYLLIYAWPQEESLDPEQLGGERPLSLKVFWHIIVSYYGFQGFPLWIDSEKKKEAQTRV